MWINYFFIAGQNVTYGKMFDIIFRKLRETKFKFKTRLNKIGRYKKN